ncbi:MAG: hypothetical protein ACP5VE_04235 [Chthonomonadales bacterium]
MKAQEMAAMLTRDVADSLLRTVQAMPAEKQMWKPLDVGRNAHDMIVECASANFFVAEALATREIPRADPHRRDKLRAEADTVDKALLLLSKSVEALASAQASFPDDLMEQVVTLPFASEPARRGHSHGS